MRIPSYDDGLLHLAEDLARRLLPAFDTPTGILLEPFYHLDNKFSIMLITVVIASTINYGIRS